MDFYLYTFIIRIGTKLYIFHHIKIPTIISNIGFMIVHTVPATQRIHLNFFPDLYGTYIYIYINVNFYGIMQCRSYSNKL